MDVGERHYRDLFPSVATRVGYSGRRDYVESRLIELAGLAPQGAMDLEELANQGPVIRDLISHVLLGFDLIDDRLAITRDVAPELAEYMVDLESIDGSSEIRYKRGHRSVASRLARGPASASVVTMMDNWSTPCGPSKTAGRVPLPVAWQALLHGGERIAVASPHNRKKLWKYRQVCGTTESGKKSRASAAHNG